MKKSVGIVVFTTIESRKNPMQGVNYLNRSELSYYVFSSTPTLKKIKELMSANRRRFVEKYKCEKAVSALNHITVFDEGLFRNTLIETNIILALNPDLKG